MYTFCSKFIYSPDDEAEHIAADLRAIYAPTQHSSQASSVGESSSIFEEVSEEDLVKRMFAGKLSRTQLQVCR